MIVPNRAGQGPANSQVAVIAYDGLCTFEFGCAVEVFGLRRPEMGEHWYRFEVAAAEPGPLRATGGIAVTATRGLEALESAGTIIMPGWRDIDAPPPAPLLASLREAHRRGARIVSLCSGAFVLAEAGLLDSRRATTHWRYAAALAARYPALRLVSDVLYVDEGSVLTASGSAAGLDLCLHIVRRDWGAEAANKVARRLVLPAHRDGGQAQYVERPVPRDRSPGARLGVLLDRIRAAPAEDWPVARLAAETATSPRSIHRRFQDATGMSPGAWVAAARVAHARTLLEATELGIEEVARLSGFAAAATLRHHVRAQLGIGPAAYRARFRLTPDRREEARGPGGRPARDGSA